MQDLASSSHEQLPPGTSLDDVGVASPHQADNVRFQKGGKVEECKKSDSGGQVECGFYQLRRVVSLS